jgi:predicted RNase H-like nuclease (RuvC/YqgF family)
MPEQNSKYLNNYLNGVTYENAFWKIQYNELWNRFLYLQNENNRLYSLLNECYRENTETTQTAENTTETTENIQNREIISHLQNKNNQLINTVMDKSKEIFMLQGELEKHRNGIN